MSDDITQAADEWLQPQQGISIHKLDKTHRKILLVCEDCPEAVNDRPLLLAKFYENDWDYNKSLYENFTRLTRVETVVRRFRDLREWGYVKQSKTADTRNYKAYKNERDKHSPIPPAMKAIDEMFDNPMEKLDKLIPERKSYFNQEHLFPPERKINYG